MRTIKASERAFTLIELIVVIAIIGLLATLSIIALVNSRINARDSKRFADIRQIRTVLELYYNDAGRYPTIEEFESGKLEYFSSGVTTTYISVIPSAPVQADGDCSETENNYDYKPSADGTTYTIDFCVAKQASDLPPGNLIAFPGGITFNSNPPDDNNNGGDCTPDCSMGGCGDDGCGGVCETAETDAQLCSRLEKNCGSLTATDNCGNSRTVADCGTCSVSQSCSDGTCVEFTCGVDAIDYNGFTYNTVMIGTQCWLKENLRTTKFRNGSDIPKMGSRDTWRNLTDLGYGYYNDDISYASYGLLYSGYAVTSPLRLCPEGWRVPSRNDFLNLISAAGANSGPKLKSCRTPGSPLGGSCDTSTHPYWIYAATNYGNDYYGFSALPGGYISGGSSGNFNYINNEGHFWTSTPYTYYIMDRNYYVSISYGGVDMYAASNAYQFLNGGLSVRCIKGETVAGKNLATISTVTPTDITANTATAGGTITADGGSTVYDKGVVWSEQDNPVIGSSQSSFKSVGTMSTSFTAPVVGLWAGRTYYLRAYAVNEAGIAYGNTITFTTPDPCDGVPFVNYNGFNYSTVAIGTQCWLRENLKTHQFRDGSNIPVLVDRSAWRALAYGGVGYGSYNGDPSLGNAYGELYSQATLTDARGLCPEGWSPPSMADFNTLITASGPNSCSRLKSCRMPGSPMGGSCDTSTHPYWIYAATNYGNDYYGFSALPGGYINGGSSGVFSYFGTYAHFWTTTAYDSTRYYYASVYYSTTEASVGGSQYAFSNGGLSVRCIKN